MIRKTYSNKKMMRDRQIDDKDKDNDDDNDNEIRTE